MEEYSNYSSNQNHITRIKLLFIFQIYVILQEHINGNSNRCK